jgi:hypothetical protein
MINHGAYGAAAQMYRPRYILLYYYCSFIFLCYFMLSLTQLNILRTLSLLHIAAKFRMLAVNQMKRNHLREEMIGRLILKC